MPNHHIVRAYGVSAQWHADIQADLGEIGEQVSHKHLLHAVRVNAIC